LLKIEYRGVQNGYKVSDFYLVQLVKFEVLHDQSQLPYLFQSGSTKGSTNKVTMANDIPVLIPICFVYTLMVWSAGFLGHTTHYYVPSIDTVSITNCLALQNIDNIRYFKSQIINKEKSKLLTTSGKLYINMLYMANRFTKLTHEEHH